MKHYLFVVNGRRRRAVSEVLATLMMIAITLVAGAAVIGWVNGQAGTSEKAYGNSAANNINYLNERFAPESQVFSNTAGAIVSCAGSLGIGGTGPGCESASFYLYNDGSLAFTLYSVRIVSTSASNPLNIVLYSACTTSSGTCTNPTGGNREVVTAPSPCTVAVPCYPSFVAAGTSSIPTGFYMASGSTYSVVPVLPVGSLSTGSNGPYQITLPSISSAGQLYMYDGVAYTITFTGLYGNTVQETITANG
jgi:flagellin-like protein